ncbi:unnamed protein product [Darwinula stevensoni]|uniref:Uncharacterized protein n=1 Tax=Darwinula stevensoni TaxID=69355 RepID=A0A7R9AJ84_9CRUS|nr:unnamed protein product [Darwinula stevensoni]CAG0907268.1 unnamed protein product [Darwinula stevensoni]
MTKLHRSQRLQEFIDFDRDNLYYHSMKYMREERKKRRGVKRNQGQKETQVERRKDTMGQDEGVSHETRGHRYVIEYPSSQEREDPTTEPDPESGSHAPCCGMFTWTSDCKSHESVDGSGLDSLFACSLGKGSSADCGTRSW